ncbi:MAG: hypothetical protein IK085_05230 [Clostridia bacterium]|nr:hypothetical protein [Clostridia bacterium]
MKKSTRILSVILALTMLLGIFSVMGSAYQAYRDSAITASTGAGYDDLDKPRFTTEQYATMAMEALEKLLAEQKIYLSPDQLLNLTDEGLDLRSINKAIISVAAIYNNVSQLLSIAGDAGSLSIDALYYNKSTNTLRTRGEGGNTTDVDLLYAVLTFLEDNKTILTKYVAHTISLGALNSLVADYLFDVRTLAFKALYHVMNDSYDILDGEIDENNMIDGKYNVAPGSGDADKIVADLLYYALIGKHTKVNGEYILPDPDDNEGIIWEYLKDLPAAEIDQILADLDINNANYKAYDFIENLMVNAFNYIAVPVLNNVTRPWLREVCGIIYDKDKMDPNSANYDPDYDGEDPTAEHPLDPQLSAIFDVDGMHIPKYDSTFPGYNSNKTFIGNFNAYFGYVLECVLAGSASNGDWTWDNSQGDTLLLKNICSVGKFILANAGDKFFEPYITVYSKAEINGWSDQEVVAYVLRVILNESVSWMYIDDNQKTIADVGYAAVEQLAWQDLPQLSYTKPARASYANDYSYYVAIVDQALNILMDIAAYKINNNIDMVVGANGKAKNRTATSPAVNAGSGLLEYSNNYETLAVQIATWGVHNYAGMLTGTGCAFENINTDPNNNGTVGGVTAAQVWADLDTIINALVPIKGNSAWIHGDIANQSLTIKYILFNCIVYPILNINDVSNLEKLLSRNTSGELATNTTKKALIDLVTRVINTIFPGTVTAQFASLDALVVNSQLATIVGNLIDSLYTHGRDWLGVALPVVCDILNFTDEQSFGEMECYMPEIVTATEANAGMTFEVYNGSSGINTGYTNSNGVFTQDQLYVYDIQSVVATSTSGSVGTTGLAAGQSLGGGAFKNLTLTGNGVTQDSIITLDITYKVKSETGAYLADGAKLKCTRYCYVDSVAQDDSEVRTDSSAGSGYTLKAAPTVYGNRGRSLNDALGYSIAVKDDAGTGGVIRVSNVSTTVPWIEINPDASVTTEANNKLTWTLTPFQVKEGYVRFSESYDLANVTSSNFKTFGNTDPEATTRATDLYTRNANGYTYTLVPQSADYNAATKYYTYKSNVASTANGVDYDEEGNVIIRNGTFTATFTVTTPAGTGSRTVTIFLYDDKGLESLYNNAVAANRQSDDFENAGSLYNTYKSALNEAGLLVLNPKKASEFPTTAGQYAAKYGNLYAAIEALDKKAKTTGTGPLQTAIGSFVGNINNPVDSVTGTYYSNNYYIDDAAELNANYVADGNDPEKVGWNNVQYWATTAGGNGNSRYAYSYFGNRDYVGHDYKKFRNARNSAQSIIDSQVVYPPIEPVEPANASVYEHNKWLEEHAKYEEELEAYNVRVANIPALNSVAVAYALSMVNLTGNRLIELPGDKSKLIAFRTTYEKTSQGNYSASTWEEYTLAKNFADYTIGDPAAKPEQITEALSQYVRAYKRLCKGVDYSALDARIIAAAAILGRTVTDVAASINALDAAYSDAEDIKATLMAEPNNYSAASSLAFANAFVSAIDIRKADLGDSTANENTVAEAAQTLLAAIDGLELAGGTDPVIVTYDPDDLPADYESPFFRADYMVSSVPYVDNYYTELYTEGEYYIAGIGVDYDVCDPYDVFQTLDNCYAVWTPNEMEMGSTASYITIYTDDTMETEIATYYVVLYGDCDGDGTYSSGDTYFCDIDAGIYQWDGIFEHFIMAIAGDADGDEVTGGGDSMILDDCMLGRGSINQDYDGHFSGGIEYYE